jgi:CHAT domain-containing protein/Tfp pilus assembly protein PilF
MGRRSLALLAGILLLAVAPHAVEQAQPQASAGDLRQDLAAADALLARREREPLDRAIAEYRRLIPRARAAGLADVEAAAEFGAGKALGLRGQFDAAVVHLRNAATTYESLGPAARYAEVLAERGMAEGRVGQTKTAVAMIAQAVDLARQSGDQRTLGIALNLLGWSAQFGLSGEAARRALEESIAVNRSAGNNVVLVDSILGLGFQLSFSNAANFSQYYEEGLAIARQNGDARGQGFALGLLGYYRDGERGLADFAEAIPLTRRAGDDIQLGYHYNGVGTILYKLARYRAALTAWQECLALRRQINHQATIGETLNNIGVALVSLGRSAESIAYFEQAIALHRSTGNAFEEAITTIGLSDAASRAGDPARALELAERARQLAIKTGHLHAEAGANNYRGVALIGLGRYQEGVAAYELALAGYEQLRSTEYQASVHRQIALAWSFFGDSAKARAHLERAVALAADGAVRASALSQLAVLQEEAGAPKDVVDKALEEAMRMARGSQAPVARARVHHHMGAVALHRGDARRAIQMFTNEIEDLRAGEAGTSAGVLVQLGTAETRRGNNGAALRYFNRALTDSAGSADPATEAVVFTALMNYWRRQGRLEVAALFGKQAIDIHQRTRADLARMDVSIQRSYLESRASVYRDLADVLIAAGRLPEAQAVLDLLKQEEFLEFVRRNASATADRPTQTQSEAAWSQRYAQIRDQIMAIGQERGELRRMSNRTEAEQARLEALDADLQVANRAFNELLNKVVAEAAPARSEAAALRIREVQGLQPVMTELRAIGDGSVLVYVLVMPEHLQLVMFSGDARKATKVPIRQDALNRRVQAFRRALQHPGLDPRPAGEELYRLLVKPIARDLEQAQARSIVWALDGALRYVPMAALWDGQRYLAETYRTVIDTPASQRRFVDQSSTSWQGLGVGVSRSVAGFSGLPFVSEELRTIFSPPGTAATGLVPGRVLIDDAFTNEAFREALRSRSPVVHVASHFKFQPGNDESSFLLLGDGSRLTLAEVNRQTELFEGVELLTLSACETAVGDVGAKGVEVESLGVIAQRQGAKAVIAGLWSVADESTRVLMEQFYRGKVAQGLNKAEALRQAQLAMLNGRATPSASATNSSRGLTAALAAGDKPFTASANAPWAHPYYWAPFILIGNWR